MILTDEMRMFLNDRLRCDLIVVAYQFRVKFNLTESQAGVLINKYVCGG